MKHRFPFMSVPSTAWRDILYQVCTKDEMIFHCELFNISHLKSMNKVALSKAIENAWLNRTEDLARMLPLSELKSLQTILQAGGTLKPSDTMPTEILEVAKIVLSLSDDPIIDTPIFDGLMPNYAIPDNLRFALNLVVDGLLSDQTYLEWNRKEQLLLGVVHLYGVISELQLSMVWEQTLNEKWDFVFYRRLMKEKVVLKMEIDPFLYQKNLCLVSDRVDDPYRIYDAIQERKDLNYAIYSEEFLLSFAESPFSNMNEGAMKSFLISLANIYDDDVVEITLLMNEIWTAFQHEAPFSELMNILTEEGVFKSLTKREIETFIPTLIDFSNAIPLWILKGHSPDSLHAKRNVIKQKPIQLDSAVGRNELCPCGSGLKYKKCCGAN